LKKVEQMLWISTFNKWLHSELWTSHTPTQSLPTYLFKSNHFNFTMKVKSQRSFSILCNLGRGCKGNRGEGKRTNPGTRKVGLCTSLIRHCQGMGFYFRLAEEGTMVVAARRYKRRILFCKCAPGNWSSCCSCVGSFYTRLSFAILIKTSRKEVPVAVQSTQKNDKRSSTIEIVKKNSYYDSLQINWKYLQQNIHWESL